MMIPCILYVTGLLALANIIAIVWHCYVMKLAAEQTLRSRHG